MHILLVNDDGISSAGLRLLAQELSKEHRVSVAAPDGNRSAVGHGITTRTPVFVTKEDWGENIDAYAVTGTPADCTRVALDALLKEPADLVISGPNVGTNVSFDVFYSGTVSAALEGAMSGVRSIAVSAAYGADEKEAVRIFMRIFEQLDVQNDIEKLLNINIPARAMSEIKGVKWVPQRRSFHWDDHYYKRCSPDGQEYYWMYGEETNIPQDGETDLSAVDLGYVALTPLCPDITDETGFRNKQFKL